MNPFLQATLIAIAYGAVLFGIIKLFGVSYTEITKNTNNIKKGIFLPIGIGSIILTIVSAFYGWLTPVFTPPTGFTTWWMWAIPLAIMVGIIIRFRTAKWHLFTRAGIWYLVVGALFVGFSEELLTRGILVHALSQPYIPQYLVMLVSSILFGLLHGMNYFNGQDRKTTITQIIITTLIGMSLYVSYIVSGTLWVPIALHALFDISLLAQGNAPADTSRKASSPELLTTLVFYAGTVVAFIVILVNNLAA